MYKRRFLLVSFSVMIALLNLGAVPSAPYAVPVVDPVFGYQWELIPSLPAERWVDISATGTELFIGEGDNRNDGYVQLNEFISTGFKLFDEEYFDVWINVNGLVSFGNPGLASSNDPIPFDAVPNGLVAGFWTDLTMADDVIGAVYYQYYNGVGNPLVCAAVDECLVVQWDQVLEYATENRNTFQIVLLDNNNIHFLYHTLAPSSGIATIGLEAGDGVYGVQASYLEESVTSGNEIIFTYPNPVLRHKVRPVYQSEFLTRNGNLLDHVFTVSVTNNGDIASPTSEIYEASVLPSNLPAGWTVTPLLSNTAGTIAGVDTGSISQGQTREIQVKVTAPLTATVGEYADVDLVFTSQDGARVVETKLFAAYAAPFAQIVHNNDLFLHTMWEKHQVERLVHQAFTGRQMSVTQMSGLTFFVAWEKRGQVGVYQYSDIEYAFVSSQGSGFPLVMKNTQNFEAEYHPLDHSPAVGVGPNGLAAYAFIREEANASRIKRYNVHLTILKSDGTVAFTKNLTNNTKFYNESGAPKFLDPRLAITSDGKYVVTWTKTVAQRNSVEMAIVNPNGTLATLPGGNPFVVWDDATLAYRYYEPALTRFNGTQVLLAAQEYYEATSTRQIVYTVINTGNGSVGVKTPIDDALGGTPDAAQLWNGEGLIAWKTNKAGIAFALINSNGTFKAGPVGIAMPNARPMQYVSAAPDVHGNAILTWLDSYDDNLYYAYVSNSGDVLTPAMVMIRGTGASPVRSSQLGYGNAFFDGKVYSYLPLLRR